MINIGRRRLTIPIRETGVIFPDMSAAMSFMKRLLTAFLTVSEVDFEPCYLASVVGSIVL
jgi:hypothetical protein